MYTVTIEVNGVVRNYKVDYDQAINKNWNEEIEDMVDTVEKIEKF